jgi:hypothetical protein
MTSNSEKRVLISWSVSSQIFLIDRACRKHGTLQKKKSMKNLFFTPPFKLGTILVAENMMSYYIMVCASKIILITIIVIKKY